MDLKELKLRSHGKEYFEGISQVLFFKNAYFGLALLLISFLFHWQFFICGLGASLIGFTYSTLYRTPKILRQTGLMTINGFFFGLAFASLFQVSGSFYFCLLLGAIAIPLMSKATFEILQHWKLSPLILPYILTLWILWLCSSGIALHPNWKIWMGDESQLWQHVSTTHVGVQLVRSMLFSMSQIFFLQNSDYGLSLLLLVTVFSPRRGLYFFMGTAMASLVFYGISDGTFAWQYGFFSCSAGLVGLGMASLPEEFSWRTISLFSVLSLFLTLASDRLFRNFGLPILSLPYVLTFWFAILSRAPRLNLSWARSEVI